MCDHFRVTCITEPFFIAFHLKYCLTLPLFSGICGIICSQTLRSGGASVKTLYDTLVADGVVFETPAVTEPTSLTPCAALSGKAFAEAVLRSEEFRLYIIEGLTDRT